MATLIKHIIGKSTEQTTAPRPVECNYSNNYYGDQVCRPIVNNKTGDQ
ncbi:hypothetical protein [Aestuariibacter sp. GS-14]|nr:hypothetical protein [Aestuariibacter sp. GS-14]